MSYTQENRNEVLQLRKAGWSYRAIEQKTGISKSLVWRWCSNFAAESTTKDMSRKNSKPTRLLATPAPLHAEDQQIDSQETDTQKIARLERELKNAQLKADFYEEMVNVAEKQFNINIRKKAGAKQ